MKAAWLIFGIILGASFTPIIIEAVEYYGKFPPTAAWQTLEIDANSSSVDLGNNQTFINATSYRDKLWIVTDGSIEVFFVEHP